MSLLESRDMPILLWADLSVEQVESYERLQDPQERRKYIAEVLKIPDDSGERQQILLDLYHNVLLFCMERAFTPDKTSSLFSIVAKTHKTAMDTFWPLEKTFAYFKNLLMKHSVQRPPFSVGIFSLNDVRAINDYMTKGYFRHYMLYKYCFTKKTELDLETVDCHTEVPMQFAPLRQAVPEEEALQQMSEQEANVSQAPALTEEDLVDVPDHIRGAVIDKVNTEMVALRQALEAQFAEQEKAMVERMEALQSKLK